jgi:hypothetical protein
MTGLNRVSTLVLLAAAVVLCSCRPPAASRLSVEWKPDPAETNRWCVEVSGLAETHLNPDKLQDALTVYAEQGSLVDDVSLPPMLGRHEWRDGTLVFTPEFPLQPGLSYRAVFRAPGATNAVSVIARLRVPALQTEPSTVVSAVYPSADELPENLLKFYLHFSAPMSRGHIYDHIHLLDARGERIELPFLEIDEELWNPEMTRLTLFIDPGRIKRGVKPLEEIGPTLEAGQRYTLVIDREWRDAAGQPLAETFRKEFAVIASDRTPPEPKRWTIRAPAAASRDPLVVQFDEPLDAALAQRLVRVRSGERDLELAETRLGDGERELQFTPVEPWPRGELQLTVVTTIEDLAGNNVGKPFEVDLFEGVERRINRELVAVPFVTR